MRLNRLLGLGLSALSSSHWAEARWSSGWCMIGGASEKVGGASRPDSVIWYERLAGAALVTGLGSAAANPASLAKYYSLYPIGYPIMFLCSILGQSLWIWLIARKRQNWARWISLVMVIIGIPSVIIDFDERFRLNAVAAILFHIGYLLLVVAVVLLFRSDARQWFSRARVAPDV